MKSHAFHFKWEFSVVFQPFPSGEAERGEDGGSPPRCVGSGFRKRTEPHVTVCSFPPFSDRPVLMRILNWLLGNLISVREELT